LSQAYPHDLGAIDRHKILFLFITIDSNPSYSTSGRVALAAAPFAGNRGIWNNHPYVSFISLVIA
jgi:hypothetical protein